MVYKGCKRCNGDLYEEEFLDSLDLVCLQCGDRRSITTGGDRGEQIRATRWLQATVRPRAA